MAIVFTDILGGQRPLGASCDWPTADVRYWRSPDRPCFWRLQIRGYDASGGGGPVYGVRGGWWTGIIGDPRFVTCGGGSDPLISFWLSANTYIYIDVWTALAQGLWTSSTVITCVPVYFSPNTSRRAGIYVGPESGPVPATVIPLDRNVPYPGSCANPPAWTVTVRDDGTFTVA